MRHFTTLSEDEPIIPISLVQSYLRIDDGNENEIVLVCMKRAEEYIQKYFKIVISGKTQQITTDEAPFGCVKLSYGPIQEIKSISVGGKALEANEYQQEENIIKILTQYRGDIELTIKFGYPDIDKIPGTIQSLFLQLTLHFYQNKDGSASEAPLGIIEASRRYNNIKI